MIVKNEKDVIETCLNSVKPLIDYWVIVDTGSTDGTQEMIQRVLATIPGELHERPWVDFAHNRNEALALAKEKGDYLLLIDADEVLRYPPAFSLPSLDKEAYYITVRQIDAVDFLRPSLISTRLPWKWEGVLHETLNVSVAKEMAVLEGIINICDPRAPSGRSKDPDKYLKDAQLLEKALEKEPANARYTFYLAQSYYLAKKPDLALHYYQKRGEMASPDVEETFFALYNVGKVKEEMGDRQGAIDAFFKAHAFRPQRAEPLFRAAVLYRKAGNALLGYLLSKYALEIPRPADMCIESNTYDYAIQIEWANCSLLLGRWAEGLQACNQLLANPALPPDLRTKVKSNREAAEDLLIEQSVAVQ
jgi:glycosyltransferase involved in cell wall biosynthesis